MVWDGKDRRLQDHDTLIEVVQILKLHVANFDKHVEKDDKNFLQLNRALWIAVGAVLVIEFGFKLFK